MLCLLNSIRRQFSRIRAPEDVEGPFFQIENLPPNNLEQLVQFLDSGRDILNLSLATSNLYLQFKALGIQPFGMDLTVSANQLSLLIIFDKDRHVLIKVEELERMSEEQKKNGSEVTKGKLKFMFCDCPLSPNTTTCFVKEPKRFLKPLVELLSRNFPTNAYQSVLIDTDMIRGNVTAFLEYVPVKKTQELVVKGEETTTDQVKVLMDDFKVQKKLTISDNLIGSIGEFKSLHIPILSLQNASWVTSDHLINSSSQIIIAQSTALNTYQLLKFLETWLNGTNDTLKYIILEHESPSYDALRVVASMRAVPWDPRHRDGTYIMKEGVLSFKLVNCEDGYDLWRRDTLATMVFNKQFFGFFIWEDRFPSRR